MVRRKDAEMIINTRRGAPTRYVVGEGRFCAYRVLNVGNWEFGNSCLRTWVFLIQMMLAMSDDAKIGKERCT